MNGVRGGGGGSGGVGRRKTGGNRSKERDEDLVLFREMHKREKDRVVSLLQPVSDEFELSGGNYALYRMASGKKGPAENEKNDYDWLKTPPATPLFPSLEMEANAPEMVVQRELPIIQTLSRFAGNSETAKKASTNIGRSKSPSPKFKVPLRSITPSRKSNINSSNDHKKNSKSAPILSQKTNQVIPSNTTSTTTSTKNPLSNQNGSHINFLASNLSKSIGLDSSKAKPTSRGVSPQVRSTTNTSHILGFLDETPPNLKTDRSESALRGRPDRSSSALKSRSNRSDLTLKASSDRSDSVLRGRSDRPESTLRGRSETQNQNQLGKKERDSTTKMIRRQSCSPSRKMTLKKETNGTVKEIVTTPKGKYQSGNGGQVFGSRMVDKFLNARKSSAEERDTKPKLYGSINESSGFGRLMAKSSLDMQDNKRESANFRHNATGRRSTNTSYNSSSKVDAGTSRH